jgi:CheY-like chemotaxis protein
MEIQPEANCNTFRDSDSGLEMMMKDDVEAPDLLFIDINMPRMSGDICLRKLRQMHKFDATRIVMISTSLPESLGRKLKRHGATFVFSKPIDLDDYNDILRQCFDVHVEITTR